jgi:hypothetical protein
MDINIDLKEYKNGDIISLFITHLYNEYKFKNILFVRTCTTGDWQDKLLINEKNITRILYFTNKTEKKTNSHKLTNIIDSNDLENTLKLLNKNFDLICIDPFHEYNESKRDFSILSSFLTKNGILISHDCFPENKDMSTPYFKEGGWCGETYVAFIEFAYKNPSMYYAILNIDTGIGIMSKIEMKLKFVYQLQTTESRPRQATPLVMLAHELEITLEASLLP